MDFLYTEADGVLVRALKKGKHIEVSHGVMYEGWRTNGDRVSLKNPKVIMTTQPIDRFWKEVQAFSANEYSLKNTQIVSNSDGGPGYSAERFQEAFSQSKHSLLHQLDAYHVEQAIHKTFGYQQCEWKDKIHKALKAHDLDKFTLILDTYESQLEDDQAIDRVHEFRTYILNHWSYIPDWREKIDFCQYANDARSLGAMESHKKRITYCMKRRNMHWNKEEFEAMVK